MTQAQSYVIRQQSCALLQVLQPASEMKNNFCFQRPKIIFQDTNQNNFLLCLMFFNSMQH